MLVPEFFSASQDEQEDASWRRHFSHGVRPDGAKGHHGEFTYVASADESHGSFLPMDKDGEPSELLISEALSARSDDEVQSRLPPGRSSYPLALSNEEANAIYESVAEIAHTRILSVTSFP